MTSLPRFNGGSSEMLITKKSAALHAEASSQVSLTPERAR